MAPRLSVQALSAGRNSLGPKEDTSAPQLGSSLLPQEDINLIVKKKKQFDVLKLPGNYSKFGLVFILHLAVLGNKIKQSDVSSTQVPMKISSVI